MARADSVFAACARTMAMGVAVSVPLGLVLSAFDFTWQRFALSTAISMLYATSIAVPLTLTFRRLRPRLAGRPALQQWLAYVGVAAAITALGSLFSGLVLVAVGVISPDRLWRQYLGGAKISLAVAVPMMLGAATVSKLRRRLADSERETERARLASLESRVRPHFLFNALNSAIALIPEDPQRAEDVLVRLAALLRFSLDAESPRLVAFGEELRVATDYLEIERVRFGARLTYKIEVPDDLAATKIPAFAVQTLVENSVKYAVASRTSGATIVVRARRDGDRLVLEVRDDGPGFAGPIWIPGHGLDGLRARLAALYGSAARIVPRTQAGAEVVLELPIAEGA
jgi:signal transduction histidine kinase